MMRTFVRRLVRYKGPVIPLSSIDKEFVIGFLEFLNNENREAGGTDHKNNRVEKPITENTKLSMYERLVVALNKAERDDLILKNPCNSIDNKYKPKRTASTRCYLTLQEVKKIIKMDYQGKTCSFRRITDLPRWATSICLRQCRLSLSRRLRPSWAML